MPVSERPPSRDKGRLFGKKPGPFSMRARGLWIERQMDLIVCTRLPEEVESHHTEGPEEMLCTREILRIPEFAARRSWALPGFLLSPKCPGHRDGAGRSYIVWCSAGPEDPVSSLGRSSVSICGARGLNWPPRAFGEWFISRAES